MTVRKIAQGIIDNPGGYTQESIQIAKAYLHSLEVMERDEAMILEQRETINKQSAKINQLSQKLDAAYRLMPKGAR